MSEAIQQVRADLGRDALIVSSRRVRRSGLAGWFSRPWVEVVAAVEGQTCEAWAAGAPPSAVSPAPGPAPPVFRRLVLGESPEFLPGGPPAPLPEATQRAPGRPDAGPAALGTAPPVKPPASPQVRVTATAPAAEGQLAQRLEQVEGLLLGLNRRLEEKGQATPLSPAWLDLSRRLRERGISEETLERLHSYLWRQLPQDRWQDAQALHDQALAYFQGIFQGEGAVPAQETALAPAHRAHNYVFVGPTGVGKTTTLAKLAARLAWVEGRRIGLITLDTYRIAAVEQLRTYAEIMGIPLEVAFTPADLQACWRRLQGVDVVLVDTAGRSPRNSAQMRELSELLQVQREVAASGSPPASPLEPAGPAKAAEEGKALAAPPGAAAPRASRIFLVLSSTTSRADAELALEAFSDTGFNALVFTKLDETRNYGLLAEVVRRARVPVAYVSDGQNVPDDLHPADPLSLARLILDGSGGTGT